MEGVINERLGTAGGDRPRRGGNERETGGGGLCEMMDGWKKEKKRVPGDDPALFQLSTGVSDGKQGRARHGRKVGLGVKI